MNTSSFHLQRMKMAARMSRLSTQTPQRWDYLLYNFKEGWPFHEWWLVAKKNVSSWRFWRIYQPLIKQKQWKSMVWKSWKQTSLTNTLNWSSHFNFTRLSRVILSSPKLFIRTFHTSFVNKIKRFLAPFRLVSTCILFIKKSLMRSEFWQLQS